MLRSWPRYALLAAAALVLLYALTPTTTSRVPGPAALPNYAAERARKDSVWRFAADSPLPDSARARFRGLHYFPAAAQWRLTAHYEPLPTPDPLLVPMTHTDAPQPYLRVAKLTFELDGHACTLTALRRPAEPADASLFVPFTDATTGHQTYGGGRYLDVPPPAPGQTTVVLDFNRTYAPTCAHAPDFQCPTPPAENALPAAVAAGERE